MIKWNLQLFGGRGAGSGGGGLPTLKPSGGGSGSGGNQFSNGVGLQNIDTLKEALGKKRSINVNGKSGKRRKPIL